MTLEKLISELNFVSDIEQAVQRKILKDSNLIKEIAETAYCGENFNFALCRRLIIESFVLLLQDNTFTVGCCLSNSEFMFGHYIECEWDCDWNLINSYIC